MIIQAVLHFPYIFICISHIFLFRVSLARVTCQQPSALIWLQISSHFIFCHPSICLMVFLQIRLSSIVRPCGLQLPIKNSCFSSSLQKHYLICQNTFKNVKMPFYYGLIWCRGALQSHSTGDKKRWKDSHRSFLLWKDKQPYIDMYRTFTNQPWFNNLCL